MITLSDFFDIVKELAGNPQLTNSRIFLYMRLNFPYIASLLRETNKDITLKRKQFTTDKKVVTLSDIFDDLNGKNFYLFIKNLYVIIDGVPIKLKASKYSDSYKSLGPSYGLIAGLTGMPTSYYHEGTTINFNITPDKPYTFVIEYYPYSFDFIFRNFNGSTDDPVMDLPNDDYTGVSLELPEEFIRLYALKVADDLTPVSDKERKVEIKEKLLEALMVVKAMGGKHNVHYYLDSDLKLGGLK